MKERAPRVIRRAYVALGSNRGDPVAKVQAGMTALGQLPQTRVECCSSLYRTAPMGAVVDQPDFINAVCRIKTELDANALMKRLLDIEARHGRVRDGEPGGPRTLDLDLLMIDHQVIATPELTLPHPRLHERAFVLYPLAELDPDLVIPGHGGVTELLGACCGQRVQRLEPAASADNP